MFNKFRNTTVCLMLLASLTSCSTTTSQRTSLPAAAEQSPEDWFCQVGEASEDWECVQDETLAANPVPDRLPRASAPTSDASSTNASGNDSFRRPSPPTRVQELPQQAQRQQATPARQTPAPPKPAPRTDESDQPEPAIQNVPPHVALSYQPDKPMSLLQLPADFWAVQLIAVSSKEALEEFARKNNIRGMSAARVAVNGELFYVLLLGIYETKSKAELAIADLPPPFDVRKPWIRTVGSLQRGMIAGDEVAGSSQI